MVDECAAPGLAASPAGRSKATAPLVASRRAALLASGALAWVWRLPRFLRALYAVA